MNKSKIIITITADSIKRNVVIAGKEFKDKMIKISNGRWETEGACIEHQMKEFYSENEYDISELIDAIKNEDSIEIMSALENID